MSLTNVEKTITLDVYDHDITPSVIKAIQMDKGTRTVYAGIQNSRQDYDIGQNATVSLTVLRPDKTKVQITGQPFICYTGTDSTMYGAKAELSDVALAVKGNLKAQFKITSGEQELRTEIFTINNGEALDAGDGDWAGDLDGHNLDEMAESIETLQTDMTAVNEDVSDLKEDLNDIREVYGVNLFNVDTIKSNTLLDGTTGEETTGNYDASDFIPITAGTKYTIKTFTYSRTPSYRIYFYNSSKGYIQRNVDRVSNSPNGYVFTAVTNAAYIRLNFENRNNAGGTQDPHTCVLVSGQTTINEYIPYYTAYDRTARNNISIQVQQLQNKSFCRVSNQGITDANDITFIGYCYLSANSVANLPEQSGAWYLWSTYLDGSNKLQIAYNARGTKPYIRSQVAGTWGAWEQIGKEASETALAEFYITSSIAMFPTVGCCGDSFTAGYLYNKPESQWYDPNYVPNGEYPAIGYPAVMGRLYGIDVTAYAKGGLTTTAYRTDTKGLPALINDTAKDLYIIALGLNDKTQNIPMGVETDIDTEPASATYLGNMGAIIRAIQTHAPMAKIILCKSLWVMNAGATAYNSYYQYISEGVELLSNHLGIPYLETLNDPYFCSRAYVDGLKGLHPTAPLYAGMGKHIGELVGKCVIDNPTYFYNFYVPNT